MADDTSIKNSANVDEVISTDHVSSLNGAAITPGPLTPKVQRVKVAYGDDNTSRDVSVAFPLPIMAPDASASGSITATDAVVGAPAGVLLTGTPTAASYIALALPGGEGSFTAQLTGTFGGGTMWFECSVNSTNGIDGNWSTLTTRTLGTTGTALQDGATVAGLYRGNTASMAYLRLRITGATTPSVAVVLRASDAPGPMGMNAPIPAGTNIIGTTRVQGVSVASVSTNLAAAATGTIGPVDISVAGNVTFVVKNQVAATAFTGAPVLVFEQSDDGTSWGPLVTMRADNNAVSSTHVLPANTANGEFLFDAAAESINWVRVRVTTGTATNAMTVVIAGGGMPFSPVVAVADKKDSGRVMWSAQTTQLAGVTTEAVQQLGQVRDGVVGTAVTTFPVTANKRLRLKTISLSLRTTAAAVGWARFGLRVNPTGAAVLASPLVFAVELGTPAAVIGSTATFVIPVDEFEFSGAQQFAVSFIASATTVLATVTLSGYEYAI